MSSAAFGASIHELFERFRGESLTFSDLILLPRYLDFPTSAVDLTGKLCRANAASNSPEIVLKNPFISSPMDTVTEAKMATAIALSGGIGFIHCNNTPKEQITEVLKVKRFRNSIITLPECVCADWTISRCTELEQKYGFGGFPVVDTLHGNNLLGMISRNDYDFVKTPETTKVSEVMQTNFVRANCSKPLEELHNLIINERLTRLPLVDDDNKLVGLICRKDMKDLKVHPMATRNPVTQQLAVGAAVSTHPRDRERIDGLVVNGVDVLLVDSAQGASSYQVETIKYIKEHYPQIPVIAGNVVTPTQAAVLVQAGADGLRVGMGAGCLAGDVPVLMADLSYCPIKDVKVGDWVMNANDVPVKVIGKRVLKRRLDIIQIKHSMWDRPILLTSNHEILTRRGSWVEVHALDESSEVVLPKIHNYPHSLFVSDSSSLSGYHLGQVLYQQPYNNGPVDVYDIEVDCASHSFIAANMVVHNSICTTQTVCGVGRGQASAIYAVSQFARSQQPPIPVIADGGIQTTGDMMKALALGANCVMMGSVFAACEESPGEVVYQNGTRLKTYRGMGAKANKNSVAVKSRYGDSGAVASASNSSTTVFVPQGVEGRVVSAGSVTDLIPLLAQSLKHGLQDVGAKTADELRRLSFSGALKMERRSVGAQAEGNVHHLHSYEK